MDFLLFLTRCSVNGLQRLGKGIERKLVMVLVVVPVVMTTGMFGLRHLALCSRAITLEWSLLLKLMNPYSNLKAFSFLTTGCWVIGLFPAGAHLEGLIIDDYFAIGKEKVGAVPASTFAARALAEARSVYQKHSLPGSTEKDIEAKTTFKAAGAEVFSSDLAVGIGLTTVGAPLAKRLGLSVLSLRAARLSSTSSRLISRLAGNWTSILMFRRCFMSVIDEMFALAADAERTGSNFIVSQSAKVREELMLLAIFAPIICTNIAVDYCPYVFASDASLGRGAVVSTSVSQKVSEALFLGSDKKGTYSKLESSPGQLLSAVGEEHADDLRLATEVQCEGPAL